MATTQELLDSAKEAYHQLVTGNKPLVVVDQNGERVEYQRADVGRLRAYIYDLHIQINQSNGPGPMGAFF